MTDLRLYDRTGAGIVIDVETGEIYATISALAIITKQTNSTIKGYVGYKDWKLKEIPVLIHVGTKEERLLNKTLLNEAQIIELIENHRPFLLKTIGNTRKTIRGYLYETCGFIHDL